MFFTKYPHRANFAFVQRADAAGLHIGKETFDARAESFEGDVHRFRVSKKNRWQENVSIDPLTPPAPAKGGLKVESDGSLALQFNGKTVLKTCKGEGFGVMGEAWMLQFEVPADAKYFGMGEKNLGRLELSGLRTKFWNTDVWSDFHSGQWMEDYADPSYASVPYVIVRLKGAWVGILVQNPGPVFMETPPGTGEKRYFVDWQKTGDHLIVGSECGQPDVWFLVGDSLADLTRKLQALVGKTPLPPLWSLGYHQSRWGYATSEQLLDLDEKFRKTKIPCDALWLDIEYMDGYRVFTLDPANFPEGVQNTVWKLWRSRRRVVPILDPGVKRDPGYAAYDDGLAKGVFCQGPEGHPYVGLVWPGETVFPDFTQPKGRKWWSNHVRDWTELGFAGYWVDMNDPATGPVDPSGMRFRNGKDDHALHRNQYALGMQMATFDGLRRAKPRSRPFVLSRSAFIGTSRYSAVWTGDNVANHHYLRMAIPTSLNLALSGIPFNGPDLGGFGGDTPEGLMVDWAKATFLFPFLRNHTMKEARRQEPWAYSRRALGTLRHLIQLRYRLLPYLYTLFAEQEAKGEAILRPLSYDFEGKDLDTVCDQFLIGSFIMQAPFLTDGQKERTVVLPGDQPWFDVAAGEWVEPGEVVVPVTRDRTPLYIRAGAILPTCAGWPTTNRKDLRKAEFHVFAPKGWKGETRLTYVADDGESTAYRKGKRTVMELTLKGDGKKAMLKANTTSDGYGSIEARVASYAGLPVEMAGATWEDGSAMWFAELPVRWATL